MANLATVLNTRELESAVRVIHCVKDRKHFQITASASEEFFHVRIPLNKISLSASTKRDSDTIVIDKNDLKIGRTVAGFVPKVIILRGHNKVEALKANGEMFANVWIGASAMKKLCIMADDAISSNELQQHLQIQISKQYKGTKSNDGSAPYGGPWIRDIYPFENYLIFDNNGDTYRQPYVLDPITRVVALSGTPTKVYQEYSDVPKGLSTKEGAKAKAAVAVIESASAIPVLPSSRSVQYYTTTMSQEQDFDTINDSGKPLGMNRGTGITEIGTLTNYGAPNSEYANPPLKTMMNIEEALRVYLAMIADGTHKPLPPMFDPSSTITASRYPNEYREAEIAARSIGETISVIDFMRWQNKQLAASAPTKCGLSASAFAYIGDPKDISTWHYQCNSLEAIEASLDELDSTSYVPKEAKSDVHASLQVHAKKFSQSKRDKMAKEGTAKPDGSYPINSPKDVENAVKDFHRANGSPSDKAHIRKRANALGVGDPFAEVKADDASFETTTQAKGKKIKAGMPMPSVSTPKVSSPAPSVSAGGPASGKSFKIGTKVETKHGKGIVSDKPSKEHYEVHHTSGKVAVLHKSEVKKRA